MTSRTIEEIKQEIKECNKYIRETIHKTYFINETNKTIRHLQNLYLELNRAKQRDFNINRKK